MRRIGTTKTVDNQKYLGIYEKRMLGEFNTHGAEQKKRKAANNQLYKFEKIYEGTSTRKKKRGHKGILQKATKDC